MDDIPFAAAVATIAMAFVAGVASGRLIEADRWRHSADAEPREGVPVRSGRRLYSVKRIVPSPDRDH
ncbi:hypothetical protein [Gemmata sp.]|uniref:hypothetical protein n=1 Tax=Gemmata sp. TaxID=1914242 RepID=UPI003F6FA161